MKKNFSAELKDYNGKIIKDPDGKSLDLKAVALNALNGNYDDERTLSGEDKVKRYALSVRISKGGEVEVSAEEITLIKMLIGKGYAPLVVGESHRILEGE